MTLQETREKLHRKSALGMPRYTAELGAQDRVDVVEDYLNLTAVARAELERARLAAASAVHDLSDKWDRIEGWELHLRNGRRADRTTQDEIRRAKREIRPELHHAIREARFLVARLSEQIRRFEQDDAAASRLCTILAGA
jgi:hypothetical protein